MKRMFYCPDHHTRRRQAMTIDVESQVDGEEGRSPVDGEGAEAVVERRPQPKELDVVQELQFRLDEARRELEELRADAGRNQAANEELRAVLAKAAVGYRAAVLALAP